MSLGNADKILEKITGEKFSLSVAIRGYRTTMALTQTQLGKKLGVTKAYISDIENQRRFISVEQAVKFAKKLKEPVDFWAEVVLQDAVNRAGINKTVKLVA